VVGIDVVNASATTFRAVAVVAIALRAVTRSVYVPRGTKAPLPVRPSHVPLCAPAARARSDQIVRTSVEPEQMATVTVAERLTVKPNPPGGPIVSPSWGWKAPADQCGFETVRSTAIDRAIVDRFPAASRPASLNV